MKALLLALVLALAPLAFCENSDVVVLTESNFFDQVAQGTWMVEFYAPWCGHCKALAPTWETFATEAKGDINVGKVDCTVEKGLASKFGIRGYPTIKMIKDGKVYDYNQARQVEAFKTFAKSGYTSAQGSNLPAGGSAKQEEGKQEPAATETQEDQVVVLTDSNFDAETKQGVWMVEYYAPWCGHCKRLAPTWAALSTKTDGKFKVGKVDCTVNRDTCTRFGVRGYPTIKLIKDGKVYAYNGARTEQAFIAFVDGGYTSADVQDVPSPVQSQQQPEKKEEKTEEAQAAGGESKVVVLTDSDFDSKTASGDWLVEFYAPWCGHCKRLAPTWEELALKSEGVNIAKVDCTQEKGLASRFGIRGFPTIKYIKGGKLYDYKGARTVESFLEFAKSGYESQTAQDLPAGAGAKHDEL